MALRDDIRDWVLVQGHSQRSAAKQFGVARDTVARLLREPAEPTVRRYTRRTPRRAPVAAVVVPHIERWLAENEQLKRTAPKQQWTAHRMWRELQAMQIAVAESTVRLLVRQRKRVAKEVFVPLDFAPGERAEFDFGHALVLLNGVQVSLPYLAARLRFSGALFVEFFPTERQEAFLLGQRHAFEAWGGVPQHCVYDNTKAAVKAILRGHARVEHDTFRHFHSYYLFTPIFATPYKGNEKGSVENLVGMARRTFMVPIPAAATIEELNQRLWQQCQAHVQTVMAGRTEPIMALLEVERRHLRPLPERPLEIAIVREVVASSTARVRFETNQYSVPVSAAYAQLTLKADPFRVRIYQGEALIADHPRSYGRHQVVDDWRHYLPLLLQKPGAVPFAAPFRNAPLPPSWEAFRQELVARRPDGNREFVRILHLCLTHAEAEVGAAMELAAAAGSYSADAVQQLLAWANEPPTAVRPLDPQRYPHYHLGQAAPDPTIYNRLLEGHA
ncbi:MAG: IS21 family transposase [Chloroflexota bacterium]|nr:IS21 family transposase [Chloroflexota bacterium]